MSKAKIIIEYKGKRYRCNTKTSCSRSNCDLFRRDVCEAYAIAHDARLPCDDICDAFVAICGGCPKYCYKEIKAK